ncbi:unnamed protein product [Strongylus vulgaris]|uniref:Large ribosomal subunit protein P2 n=1 Tax=Strongylus vulgaris TaxID=40348 RepID=A0A3P7JIH9_STRVU|nr:unnamed protein product [Strongylus vulgaris]
MEGNTDYNLKTPNIIEPTSDVPLVTAKILSNQNLVLIHIPSNHVPHCQTIHMEAFFQLDDLKNILGAVGVDTDVEAAKLVISRLEGKSIDEVIAEGQSGLVTVSKDFFVIHLSNCIYITSSIVSTEKSKDFCSKDAPFLLT